MTQRMASTATVVTKKRPKTPWSKRKGVSSCAMRRALHGSLWRGEIVVVCVLALGCVAVVVVVVVVEALMIPHACHEVAVSLVCCRKDRF